MLRGQFSHAYSLAAACGLALSAISPASAQPPQQPATGTILGRVIDSKTSALLKNCQARLRGPVRVVYSDSTGTFRIDDLPAGHYWLDLRVSFYEPQLIPVTVDEGTASRIKVRMVQNSHQAFVEIPRRDPTPIPPPPAIRGGVLVVTVRDTTGHRVAGVTVRIEGTDSRGLTDSTGVCRIARILPGRREVVVGSVVHLDVRKSVEFAPDRETRLAETVRIRPHFRGSVIKIARDGSATVDDGGSIYEYSPDGHLLSIGCSILSIGR